MLPKDFSGLKTSQLKSCSPKLNIGLQRSTSPSRLKGKARAALCLPLTVKRTRRSRRPVRVMGVVQLGLLFHKQSLLQRRWRIMARSMGRWGNLKWSPLQTWRPSVEVAHPQSLTSLRSSNRVQMKSSSSCKVWSSSLRRPKRRHQHRSLLCGAGDRTEWGSSFRSAVGVSKRVSLLSLCLCNASACFS